MGGEIIVVAIVFGVIFGIVYLFISARNKERLALIEKGADASIFYSKNHQAMTASKVVVLNLALLLMGIGLGVFVAGILSQFGVDEEVAFPGTIFFTAGMALFLGFNLTRKYSKEEN